MLRESLADCWMTIKFTLYFWIRFKWNTKWYTGRMHPFTVACANETKDKDGMHKLTSHNRSRHNGRSFQHAVQHFFFLLWNLQEQMKSSMKSGCVPHLDTPHLGMFSRSKSPVMIVQWLFHPLIAKQWQVLIMLHQCCWSRGQRFQSYLTGYFLAQVIYNNSSTNNNVELG